MSVCKERPATLPPPNAIGLESIDHTHVMTQGGSGHHHPLSAVLPLCQASISLGFMQIHVHSKRRALERKQQGFRWYTVLQLYPSDGSNLNNVLFWYCHKITLAMLKLMLKHFTYILLYFVYFKCYRR